jgi:hypothetical protein
MRSVHSEVCGSFRLEVFLVAGAVKIILKVILPFKLLNSDAIIVVLPMFGVSALHAREFKWLPVCQLTNIECCLND